MFQLQILGHAATLQRSRDLFLPPGVIPSSRRSIDLGCRFRLSVLDCRSSNTELYSALYKLVCLSLITVVSSQHFTVMPRGTTLAFIALPLLALSLAYYAQSSSSLLGPAPHLGTGLQISLALSGLIGYAQAAVQAPFRFKTAEQPAQVVLDADECDYTLEPRPRFSRKIIAVGDIHGDIGNAERILQMAGVVDENNDWSGKVDVFVQTGDIIDR